MKIEQKAYVSLETLILNQMVQVHYLNFCGKFNVVVISVFKIFDNSFLNLWSKIIIFNNLFIYLFCM